MSKFHPLFPGLFLVVSFLAFITSPAPAQAPTAPKEEPLSPAFSVSVGSTPVPAYLARICDLTPEQRRTLGTIVSGQTAQTSFASFDLAGSAQVSVKCAVPVQSVKILPSSSGIAPVVSGNTVSFTVSKPGQLVLEINGDWIGSLQLFINPPETDAPSPTDPNVIYFGPGIHEVERVEVGSGQTVYLAPGAFVYGKDDPGSPGGPIFSLTGSNITLRGRGVIDGSLCPGHTRSNLEVHGSHIRIEGIILRDSSTWTLPVRQSDDVTIDNLKVFGWRGNSDGIDICNSRDVAVSGCYLRTLDDLIVLKTNKGQGDEHDITVKHCVLWNEFAHALSLGAELREPLSNIRFSDCDVIHDKGREWLLRVYNCDSAPVSNVVFDDIRIEEARRLMSLWIGKASWSREADRGHIDKITFQNIKSVTPLLPTPFAELTGFDASHLVEDAKFQNVIVDGKALQATDILQNAFVRTVAIQP